MIQQENYDSDSSTAPPVLISPMKKHAQPCYAHYTTKADSFQPELIPITTKHCALGGTRYCTWVGKDRRCEKPAQPGDRRRGSRLSARAGELGVFYHQGFYQAGIEPDDDNAVFAHIEKLLDPAQAEVAVFDKFVHVKSFAL